MDQRPKPSEVLAEMKRSSDAGEPLVLIPIDEFGEPNGEPEVHWRTPKGDHLN